MTNLNDKVILLRALEPADAELLYEWENAPDLWQFGDRRAPLSLTQLRDYVANYDADPLRAGQLRLMVSLVATGETVGAVDIFDVDVLNGRASVGILIAAGQRGRGYATRALKLLARYCRDSLSLHQLWCTIAAGNHASRGLFTKSGYKVCGHLRSWLRTADSYEDAYILQKFLVKAPASEQLPF